MLYGNTHSRTVFVFADVSVPTVYTVLFKHMLSFCSQIGAANPSLQKVLDAMDGIKFKVLNEFLSLDTAVGELQLIQGSDLLCLL